MNNTYDYKRLSEFDRLRMRADNIRRAIVFGELSMGQTKDALHEIKKLPAPISTEVWENLKRDLPDEEYQNLHSEYVRYCLNHRWQL